MAKAIGFLVPLLIGTAYSLAFLPADVWQTVLVWCALWAANLSGFIEAHYRMR